MVPPNGVSFARSTSTWMNWWSPVTSANSLIASWVTSCQSLTPSSWPMWDLTSSMPVRVSMAGNLRRFPRRAARQPGGLAAPERRGRRLAAVELADEARPVELGAQVAHRGDDEGLHAPYEQRLGRQPAPL